MKPWEAFGVENTNRPPPLKYNRIFLFVVTIANLIAIACASSGGWAAIGMITIYGPMANVTLSVISLLLTNSLRENNPDLSLGKHILVSVGVPMAAIVIDVLIIAIMGVPGGC